ncbi:MAG: cupredoxin domain-containing protein [bacterium]|nr:cupredoxin domain-containing protein [bacterium]MDZ4231695.1 cupredoxin domain-containing protein [Candidatus Pacearchaeota archaeon]
MRTILIVSVAVLLVVIGAVAFILKQGGELVQQIEVQGNITENVVVFTDNGYSPNVLQVRVGDKVVFRNETSGSFWPASAMHPTHMVYSGTSLSEHCPDVASTAFDACEGLPEGSEWSFTFEKAGSWKYHDHLRPSMTGTIVVQ